MGVLCSRSGRPLALCAALGLWLGACNAIFGIDELSYGPTLPQGGAAGAGGQTTSSSSTGGEAGGTSTNPFADYAYRRQLTIHGDPNGQIPQGYSLSLALDHGALVVEGKSQADGADLRVVRQIDDEWHELHRRLEPASSWSDEATQIWFMTQDATSDGDDSYWLIYGHPNPPEVLDDPLQVFLHWDDFDEEGSPSWQFDLIGNGSGSSQIDSGMLRLEGSTEDIWGDHDGFVFLHMPMSGDFVVDARAVGAGGELPNWSDLGGVMVRQTLDPGSRHGMCAIVEAPEPGASLVHRASDDTVSDHALMAVQEPLPGHTRLRRIGDDITVWYSGDGRTWLQVGTPVTFDQPLADPVLVGILFENSNGTAPGWVDVDWFRARLAIQPEPTVAVGDEQPMR